jgi:hypothetical protein
VRHPGRERQRQHLALLRGERAERLGDRRALGVGDRLLRRPGSRVGPAGDAATGSFGGSWTRSRLCACRRAIPNSQVRTPDRPAYRGAERHTASSVSCRISSATIRSPA